MGTYFHGWRQQIGIGVLVLAYFSGCAKSRSIQQSTHSDSETNSSLHQVQFIDRGKNTAHAKCRKMECQLKTGVVLIRDQELSIDGRMLVTLQESDLVTIEDLEIVAVNGVQIWPEASE